MTFLTPEQLNAFAEDGFLVLPGFYPPSVVSSLLSTTHSLLSSVDLSTHPLTRFTTGDDKESNDQHVGDDYFLNSNDKVRYFFEPGAFSQGQLTRPVPLAINKIGHSLHSLSAPFAAATLDKRNVAIARDIGFRDPRVLQSMVICKQPGIGGAVPPHKDSEFLYTDPPSAVGFWIALEDATTENGGLGFWRGSHKRSPVKRRFVRKQDGSGTEFVPWQGAGLPRGMGVSQDSQKKETEKEEEKEEKEKEYECRDEDFELVNVNAGSLVLIHGNVLHASQKNESRKSRFAYTFHVIEGAERYDERNWLQPPDGGFTRLADDG